MVGRNGPLGSFVPQKLRSRCLRELPEIPGAFATKAAILDDFRRQKGKAAFPFRRFHDLK